MLLQKGKWQNKLISKVQYPASSIVDVFTLLTISAFLLPSGEFSKIMRETQQQQQKQAQGGRAEQINKKNAPRRRKGEKFKKTGKVWSPIIPLFASVLHIWGEDWNP